MLFSRESRMALGVLAAVVFALPAMAQTAAPAAAPAATAPAGVVAGTQEACRGHEFRLRHCPTNVRRFLDRTRTSAKASPTCWWTNW